MGRLGLLVLVEGFYLYVGSAFGPGGLRARVGRHLRAAGRPHWHIDTLRRHTSLVEVWHATSDRRLEHRWADALRHLPRAELPLAGFGASDCACASHLIYLPDSPGPAMLRRALRSQDARSNQRIARFRP